MPVERDDERLAATAIHFEPLTVVDREGQRFAVNVQCQRDESEARRVSTGLGTVRVDERRGDLVEERRWIEVDDVAIESRSEINR